MPERSLAAIRALRLAPDAAILDGGDGASPRAAKLVATCHPDVTAFDLAASPLDDAPSAARGLGTRDHLGHGRRPREHEFGREFDLWHDRAVFHFMASNADRHRYVRPPERALRPGGHVILATGPDGPTRCSDLPVHRNDANELARALPADRKLLDAALAEHRTPFGNSQHLLYAHLLGRAA